MAEDEVVGKGLKIKIGLDLSGIMGGVGGVSIALNQALELFSKFEGAAQGFIDLALNSARFGKEIKDNARDLGLSTREFQQWTHTAIAAGSSAEEITGSIRMMSIRMKEAADPTSEMGRSLKALNVNVLDSSGKMRSMNDILLDVFPALNKLPEGFQRNQAAMTLFGRGFTSIADLASLSRDEIQQLIDQAPVFGDEKINQLDAFNTKMMLLNEKLERSKILMGSELIGSFTTWTTMIDGMLKQEGPLDGFFKKLNLLLEMTAEGFTLLGGTAMAVMDYFNPASGAFQNIKYFEQQIRSLNSTVNTMRDRFAHPPEVDLTQAQKEIDSTGSSASDATKKVQDLQRKLEDLNQSIIDSQLSMQGTGMEQRDLGVEYNDLLKERARISAQADPETSGGQKYAERVKEIDAEIERISLKMNVNIQKLVKEQTSITRNQQDLVSGMIEGDAKIVSSMQTRVDTTTTQYAALDTIESGHWQTVADDAGLAYQYIMDRIAEAVNFAGANPILQQIITVLDGVPSYIPPAFTPISGASSIGAPSFTKAISTPTATPATGDKATGSTGKTTNITVNQNNYGVASDADGMNRSLGKIANLTGAGG